MSIWAVALGAAVGLLVPLLSEARRAVLFLAFVPGLGLILFPEVALALLQDALVVVWLFATTLGLSATSGFAAAIGAIAVAGYAQLALRRRLSFRSWLSPIAVLNYALGGVLAIAFVYGGSSPAGRDKLIGYFAFNLLAFLLTSATPARRRRWLLYPFIGVALVGLVGVVLAIVSGSVGERLSAFGSDPIWTSRLLCAGAIITAWLPRLSLMLKGPLALAFIAGSFFTGSRGPLTTVVIVFLVSFMVGAIMAKERRAAGKYILSLGIIVIAIGVVFLGLRVLSGLAPDAPGLAPIARIFRGGEDAQYNTYGRLLLYRQSLQQFAANPLLGSGLGRLKPIVRGMEREYSHNIILEFASETGLLGLTVHLVTMGMVVWGVAQYWRVPKRCADQDMRIGLLMLLFAYVNAFMSGDLVGNKLLWYFMGFLNGILTEHGIMRRPAAGETLPIAAPASSLE